MAQTIKSPPATPDTQVRSLGGEDPLEKGMATHSSILAWRIPWTEGPDGLQSMGAQELDTTERLTHTHGTGSLGIGCLWLTCLFSDSQENFALQSLHVFI